MKWIEVNDFSSVHYPVNKSLSIKTSMFRSDYCSDSDAYIDVKGTIIIMIIMLQEEIKKLTFQNNALFRSCYHIYRQCRISWHCYANAQSSDNYSMTPGSLWDFYRDDINNCQNEKIRTIAKIRTTTTKQYQLHIRQN